MADKHGDDEYAGDAAKLIASLKGMARKPAKRAPARPATAKRTSKPKRQA